MTRRETQVSVSDWADATFGPSGSNVRVAARANEEMAELLRALASDDEHPKALEEIADIFIVLYRLAQRLGGDVHAEVDRKMGVNRAREWKLDGTGHGYHVKKGVRRVAEDGTEARRLTMANESFEVEQKVKILSTSYHGVVKKVDEQHRVLDLDVYREGEKQPSHFDVSYTFDEVVPLTLVETLADEIAEVTPAAPPVLVHVLDTLATNAGPVDRMLCGLVCPKPPAELPEGMRFVLDHDDGRRIATCRTCQDTYDRVMTPERREDVHRVRLRDRMRVRSQMPELDDRFAPEIDFPGSVVRPGEYAERTFALSRECRLVGIRKPKGLTLVRLTLKVGVDFHAVRKKGDGTDPSYTEYEGADCLVFEGEAIKLGEWKKKRLAPELSAGVYLLVRNDADDDRRFEGTLLLAEDRVPEPDHEEV